MDRLWVGYWTGGTAMAVAIILPAWLIGADVAKLLVGAAMWGLFTPAGIWVAKRIA